MSRSTFRSAFALAALGLTLGATAMASSAAAHPVKPSGPAPQVSAADTVSEDADAADGYCVWECRWVYCGGYYREVCYRVCYPW